MYDVTREELVADVEAEEVPSRVMRKFVSVTYEVG